MTAKELHEILRIDESYRIERTVSTSNMDKFQEAICAFANDLPGKRQKGYLLIGVNDDGTPSGLRVDDRLIKKISGIRSDGNILPLPVMNTEKVVTEEGDVLVVEVTPSFDTPVRYRGRTFVRIGPRRDIATIQEERILTERCAAALPTFDTRPCRGATLHDIDVDCIMKEYLPLAVDRQVLKHDNRSIEEQLASLHLYNMQWDCPTYAAIIMFGKRTNYFLQGAYVQYVRFAGEDNGGNILNERRFDGCLYKMLPRLENFIDDAIVTSRPVSVSTLREKEVKNYPSKALRELIMNAVMHRDYQSNTPTRIYQYDSRIEVMNPGGLYGNARPENFPFVNDYRNNTLAGIMKTFNYVNMFNHGIQEVRRLLAENGNKEAEFEINLLTVFLVKIHDANVVMADSIRNELFNKIDATIMQPSCNHHATIMQPSANEAAETLSNKIKSLIISIDIFVLSRKELFEKLNYGDGKSLHASNHATVSRQYFSKAYLQPAIRAGLVALLYPETPKSKKQKYYLTEKGIFVLKQLK